MMMRGERSVAAKHWKIFPSESNKRSQLQASQRLNKAASNESVVGELETTHRLSDNN